MITRKQVEADPGALMAIKSLQWRAIRLVDGHRQGLHRSIRHGTSAEFREYRDYTPGDDLRYFDWKLLARRDRMYLKRFDGETNLRCELIVDFSPSMFYGTLGYSKADYAATLAATLARFLLQQGDAVGLTTISGLSRLSYLPCRSGTPRFRPLVAQLEKDLRPRQHEKLPQVGPDCEAVFEQIAARVRRRSQFVVISDLLVPPEPLLKGLGWLTGRRHDVALLHVLDPAELEFEADRAVVLEDMETGAQFAVDPDEAAKRYAERLAAHLATIETGCRKLGVDYQRQATNAPLGPWLQAMILRRDRRQRAHDRAR